MQAESEAWNHRGGATIVTPAWKWNSRECEGTNPSTWIRLQTILFWASLRVTNCPLNSPLWVQKICWFGRYTLFASCRWHVCSVLCSVKAARRRQSPSGAVTRGVRRHKCGDKLWEMSSLRLGRWSPSALHCCNIRPEAKRDRCRVIALLRVTTYKRRELFEWRGNVCNSSRESSAFAFKQVSFYGAFLTCTKGRMWTPSITCGLEVTLCQRCRDNSAQGA